MNQRGHERWGLLPQAPGPQFLSTHLWKPSHSSLWCGAMLFQVGRPQQSRLGACAERTFLGPAPAQCEAAQRPRDSALSVPPGGPRLTRVSLPGPPSTFKTNQPMINNQTTPPSKVPRDVQQPSSRGESSARRSTGEASDEPRCQEQGLGHPRLHPQYHVQLLETAFRRDHLCFLKNDTFLFHFLKCLPL